MSASVAIVTAPEFPARHAFSTRLGGVSTGRFASLNLGAKWGDEAAAVDENRRRFAAQAGFAWERLYTARQVHGVEAVTVTPASRTAEVAGREADVVATALPGVAVGIYTADCVPVLLTDGEGRVAAAHAGWRGTVLGVAGRAVAALVALGAAPGRLHAVLGPSICVRCFEVGEEVAAQFGGEVVLRSPTGRPHVDLARANVRQLVAAGVPVAAVTTLGACTMCDPTRYFSFRRDGSGIGMQLSVVLSGGRAGA